MSNYRIDMHLRGYGPYREYQRAATAEQAIAKTRRAFGDRIEWIRAVAS